MIIDPNNSINSQSLGAGKARQQATENVSSSNDKAAVAPKAGAADSVSLSDASRSLANLESRVRDSADVDNARVAQVKLALDSGSYQIDAKAIADKIATQEAF